MSNPYQTTDLRYYMWEQNITLGGTRGEVGYTLFTTNDKAREYGGDEQENNVSLAYELVAPVADTTLTSDYRDEWVTGNLQYSPDNQTPVNWLPDNYRGPVGYIQWFMQLARSNDNNANYYQLGRDSDSTWKITSIEKIHTSDDGISFGLEQSPGYDNRGNRFTDGWVDNEYTGNEDRTIVDTYYEGNSKYIYNGRVWQGRSFGYGSETVDLLVYKVTSNEQDTSSTKITYWGIPSDSAANQQKNGWSRSNQLVFLLQYQ